jgi:hypothetical protein
MPKDESILPVSSSAPASQNRFFLSSAARVWSEQLNATNLPWLFTATHITALFQPKPNQE